MNIFSFGHDLYLYIMFMETSKPVCQMVTLSIVSFTERDDQ